MLSRIEIREPFPAERTIAEPFALALGSSLAISKHFIALNHGINSHNSLFILPIIRPGLTNTVPKFASSFKTGLKH